MSPMAECCEPGCTCEVLCPVHEYEKRLRAQVGGLDTFSVDEAVDADGYPEFTTMVRESDVLALLGSDDGCERCDHPVVEGSTEQWCPLCGATTEVEGESDGA